MSPHLVPVLLIGALVSACGDANEEKDFRSDPNRVFHRAMEAVHAGDWTALRPLLTNRARVQLEGDLNRLRRRLAHPQDGEQERRIAKARLGADYEREIRRATTGGLSEVLRFFVRISPRSARPETPQRKFARFRAEILYADDEGTLHPVRLVRLTGGWYVDDLQL